MPALTHDPGQARFVWLGTFEERMLPKEAKFRWDPNAKIWWTPDAAKARTLAKFADPAAQKALMGHEAALAMSKATDADIQVPSPEGLAYLPYQRAGIAAVLGARAAGRPGLLIADEMGLGKTIQAIGTINACEDIKRVLVICPASLKLNWQRECEKWLTRPMPIRVWDGKAGSTDGAITIINYDVVAKRLGDLTARGEYDLIVLDEAHYCKNQKAKRTKATLGLPGRFWLFLTGTPILNRPIELYTLLSILDPKGLGRSYVSYGIRYAAAYQDKWGWHFDGSSNLDELQERLRSGLMVRRLKADVLTELGPKTRSIVALAPEGRAAKAAIKAQRKAWDEVVEALGYEEAVRRLMSGGGFDFETLSSSRKELAALKAPQVVEFVEEALESSRKVVVFGHHYEMLDALAEGLAEYGVARIDGGTPNADRQAAVDRFQSDPSCRVFVGGILAAGVGLTLTAASHVILAELPWRPADIQQAEDRCHRIGQTDNVFVQHLVYDGSLDADMAAMIVAKQAIADSALDTDHDTAKAARIAEVEAEVAEATAKTAIRKAEAAASPFSDPALRHDVHTALRLLASACDGAREKDEMGFNGVDSPFGKALAAQSGLSVRQAESAHGMLRKYRRQLPVGLYDRLFCQELTPAS